MAADLVYLGVPKQDIVLGFYPLFVREMSDYIYCGLKAEG